MTVNAPEIEKTLYMYQEDRVVRTGILRYYDPLMFSDLSAQSLSNLNSVVHVLPGSDPTSNLAPAGINFAYFTLTIQE